MASITARKSAAERRAEILAAAVHLARSHGLAAITMRAVAQQAGIAPTLVVHHVDSMEQLVADAFGSIVASELVEVREWITTQHSPNTALDALLDTVFDGTRDTVTGVWVDGWSLGRNSELLAARVRTEMDAWREYLCGLIIAGCHSGRYTIDAAEAPAVAGQLLGMIDGLNAHALVGWANEGRSELMRRAADAILRASRPIE